MRKVKLHLLSSLQVERAQWNGSDQMLNDGGGLYLYIREYGSREWVFRYTSPLTTQRRKQSIGNFPDTTLKQARD